MVARLRSGSISEPHHPGAILPLQGCKPRTPSVASRANDVLMLLDGWSGRRLRWLERERIWICLAGGRAAPFSLLLFLKKERKRETWISINPSATDTSTLLSPGPRSLSPPAHGWHPFLLSLTLRSHSLHSLGSGGSQETGLVVCSRPPPFLKGGPTPPTPSAPPLPTSPTLPSGAVKCNLLSRTKSLANKGWVLPGRRSGC